MQYDPAFKRVSPAQQQPSGMPCHRYTPFQPVDLPDRAWPARSLTEPPRCLSPDLRGGNQARIDPIAPSPKHRLCERPARTRYQEIAFGLPPSAQTHVDLTRALT